MPSYYDRSDEDDPRIRDAETRREDVVDPPTHPRPDHPLNFVMDSPGERWVEDIVFGEA